MAGKKKMISIYDRTAPIRISKEVKEKLSKMGGLEDSYDSVLRKLLGMKPCPWSRSTTRTTTKGNEQNEDDSRDQGSL